MQLTARTRLLMIVLGIVVLAGAAAIMIVLATDDESSAAPPATPAAPAPRTDCLDEVALSIKTDDAMFRHAEVLRRDPRVGSLVTMTKEQSYERFKELFKDRPDLLEVATPDALPAQLRLKPAGGLSPRQLSDQLREEFPETEQSATVPGC